MISIALVGLCLSGVIRGEDLDKLWQRHEYQNTEADLPSTCSLPRSWTGKWHQADVGELNITEEGMGQKGLCVDKSEGFNGELTRYLFRSTQKGGIYCWRCLVFFDVHHNVLQYKETGCRPGVDANNIDVGSICPQEDLVAQDIITLFRVDAKPEKCPLQGPMTFTYSNLRGECAYPLSRIESCAGTSQLRFIYEGCVGTAYNSETKIEDVHCLGSWSVRGRKYFVGKIPKLAYSMFEGEYFRCFIYETESSGGRISVSSHASCRELTGIGRGKTNIVYKLDSYRPPSCNFFHRLRHEPHNSRKGRRWESIADDYIHTFGKHEWVVHDPKTGQNISKAMCIEAQDYRKSFKFTVYKVEGCKHGYQCVKMYWRSGNVLETTMGELAQGPMGREDACSEMYFTEETQTVHALLLENSAEIPCPNHGRYLIDGCNEDGASVSFGCTHSHRLIVNLQCRDSEKKTYNCHGHWKEDRDNVHYLVVKEQHTGKKGCYAYTKNDKILSMSDFYRHECGQIILGGVNNRRIYNATSTGMCDPVTLAYSNSSPTLLASINVAFVLLLLSYSSKVMNSSRL